MYILLKRFPTKFSLTHFEIARTITNFNAYVIIHLKSHKKQIVAERTTPIQDLHKNEPSIKVTFNSMQSNHGNLY